MMEREIITTDYGTTYSNQVTIIYEDQEKPDRQLILHCNPDGLYAMIHQGVVAMSTFGTGDTPENRDKNALAKLIKVAVKGILLMYGSRILDVILGKDHPKLEKGQDILDWYQDIFTRIGISFLMKNDTILRGRIVNGSVEQVAIGIDSISSRPVTTPGESGTGRETESAVNPV